MLHVLNRILLINTNRLLFYWKNLVNRLQLRILSYLKVVKGFFSERLIVDGATFNRFFPLSIDSLVLSSIRR